MLIAVPRPRAPAKTWHKSTECRLVSRIAVAVINVECDECGRRKRSAMARWQQWSLCTLRSTCQNKLILQAIASTRMPRDHTQHAARITGWNHQQHPVTSQFQTQCRLVACDVTAKDRRRHHRSLSNNAECEARGDSRRRGVSCRFVVDV
jgi:hypothetical protein